MKTLIDLSKASGKTVERAVMTGDSESVAIHFTDGTVVYLSAVLQDYCGSAVIQEETDASNPNCVMLELEICTDEENKAYNERREAENQQRVLQSQLAYYQRLKKQFEAAGGMPEPF